MELRFNQKKTFKLTMRNSTVSTVITLSIGTNSVNRDQMPQYAASDQGLHCLPYTHSNNLEVVEWTISNFKTSMIRR